MFDFIQKLIYFVLNIQKKFIQKKARVATKSAYSNKTSKKVLGSAASLELSSETNKNKLKLENNIKQIIKTYGTDPENLLKFIQKHGTKIYRIPCANKILKLIGYEEGFISSTKGFKGLFFNIIIPIIAKEKIIFSCKAAPIFVLRKLHIDSYTMIQHFYKWYAMKLDMPGFDENSQNNFQKFLSTSNDTKLKELSIDEILGLKEAIARDTEAIDFIIDFAKSTSGSKNALKKLTSGGASV